MGMIGLAVTAGPCVRMDVDVDLVVGMAMGVGMDALADHAPDDVETEEHQHRADPELEGDAPR